MTEKQSISPPPELIRKWWDDTDQDFEAVAVRAARWAADQQLQQDVKLLQTLIRRALKQLDD